MKNTKNIRVFGGSSGEVFVFGRSKSTERWHCHLESSWLDFLIMPNCCPSSADLWKSLNNEMTSDRAEYWLAKHPLNSTTKVSLPSMHFSILNPASVAGWELDGIYLKWYPELASTATLKR
jgi:hypothetical protein